MPYKRHKPVSESEMDRTRYEGHHSVCQQLRDIYHLTDNAEIRMKCRLAMAMTKAMHEKLKWYKAKEINNGQCERENNLLRDGDIQG